MRPGEHVVGIGQILPELGRLIDKVVDTREEDMELDLNHWGPSRDTSPTGPPSQDQSRSERKQTILTR